MVKENVLLIIKDPCDTIIDCKLIVNTICIGSAMEKWHQSTKYVEKMYKQEYVNLSVNTTPIRCSFFIETLQLNML